MGIIIAAFGSTIHTVHESLHVYLNTPLSLLSSAFLRYYSHFTLSLQEPTIYWPSVSLLLHGYRKLNQDLPVHNGSVRHTWYRIQVKCIGKCVGGYALTEYVLYMASLQQIAILPFNYHDFLPLTFNFTE